MYTLSHRHALLRFPKNIFKKLPDFEIQLKKLLNLKSINYIYRISKSHKSLTGFENPIIGFQNLLLSKPDLENQYYLNWISKSSIYV